MCAIPLPHQSPFELIGIRVTFVEKIVRDNHPTILNSFEERHGKFFVTSFENFPTSKSFAKRANILITLVHMHHIHTVLTIADPKVKCELDVHG